VPKIPIETLEPGMRLAKPVLNESGMVLLSEETELTDATIEKLKSMNVDGVYVKGMSKPDRPMEEMLLELDKRFEKTVSERYMGMLKKVFRKHIEGLYE
jgi:hypothetical protein